MPQYYFALRSPDEEADDENGTVLPSDEAALSYAQRVIGELKESGGYDGPGLVMVVANEAGRVLFSVPFS
jgi:uncharacterized protein DUF6894